MNMIIGKKIKELREENSLTQEQLAENLQISRSSLALYETGKRQVPNELLLKIAAYFKVSMDFLFGLED